jgi:hypothetical protein
MDHNQQISDEDRHLESRIREELYTGCVSQAVDLCSEIENPSLEQEMRQLIREYEGH